MSPSLIEACPHCGSDLRGEEIPVDIRHYYVAGSTRYSRIVAIYDRGTDRTRHFQCPDCEKAIDKATAYKASD